MDSLTNLKCVACRADSLPVSEAEIAELNPQVADWRIVEREGVRRLERVFKFRNFAEALEFTIEIGEIAEEEGHHPTLLTEWGRVTVTWWTHTIQNLHRNDFIMAARTDRLYASR